MGCVASTKKCRCLVFARDLHVFFALGSDLSSENCSAGESFPRLISGAAVCRGSCGLIRELPLARHGIYRARNRAVASPRLRNF
jgi:hypothetical protein